MNLYSLVKVLHLLAVTAAIAGVVGHALIRTVSSRPDADGDQAISKPESSFAFRADRVQPSKEVIDNKKGVHPMSTEDNKALIRHLFDEVWNKGNIAAAEEAASPTWVAHGNLPGQEMPGLEGMRRFISIYRTAFPGMHLTIEDQVAEGDKVVTRWTASATHTGPLMGIPPTGRQLTVSGIGIHRIVGGKIGEQWGIDDTLGLMQQLGVVPPLGE